MFVYGTKINSDIEFPLKLADKAAGRYELELTANPPRGLVEAITCGSPFYRAHGRLVYFYSDRVFTGVEADQPWCYEVKGIVRFYWVSGSRSIYYALDEDGDANLLSFWFIHLLLPLYFTLENMYDFLHAGAVEIEGKPVLFIAPSMGGKSTMTDYFINQGHTLISDDKVPTFIDRGRFMAVGSHPYHRPYRKFEELGYCVDNYTTEFNPIHAFYALKTADADAEIEITEIKGVEKFTTLLPNYLYTFSFLRPQRLHYLGQMLNSIKVFTVTVPWDIKQQGKVHDAICSHSQRIK
ncbi:MAG: hypothetical protein OEY01_05245 [Desulfobulbaceae bacterium]|nr:hypothetical protein [Desulfobulbaceae bacterium]